AEGKQVAAGVDGLTASLLGRHINRRPRNDPHRGQRLLSSVLLVVYELGQAEVEDLHLSGRSQKNVGGLDVAMDDPLGMGCHQRVRNLYAYVEHLLQY